MKCKICKGKINYDNSIGRDSFLVCNSCANTIKKHTQLKNIDILNVVLVIGFMMENNKKYLLDK